MNKKENTMKKFSLLIFVLICVFCCCPVVIAETLEEPMSVYNNNNILFSIPEKFNKLISVEIPEDNEYLFTVYDRDAAAEGEISNDFPSAEGLLFAIDTIGEDEYHELLCGERMFEVFAKDTNGNYYVIYYPNYPHGAAGTYIGFEVFFMYNYPFHYYAKFLYPESWISGTKKPENLEAMKWNVEKMKDLFIKNNNLVREKHGNGPVPIYISRIIYGNENDYEVAVYNPRNSIRPKNKSAVDLLLPFIYNVSYRPVDIGYEEFYTEEDLKEKAKYTEPYAHINFAYNTEKKYSYSILFMGGNFVSACAFGPNQVDSNCLGFKVEFEDESLDAEEIINDYVIANQ